MVTRSHGVGQRRTPVKRTYARSSRPTSPCRTKIQESRQAGRTGVIDIDRGARMGETHWPPSSVASSTTTG